MAAGAGVGELEAEPEPEPEPEFWSSPWSSVLWSPRPSRSCRRAGAPSETTNGSRINNAGAQSPRRGAALIARPGLLGVPPYRYLAPSGKLAKEAGRLGRLTAARASPLCPAAETAGRHTAIVVSRLCLLALQLYHALLHCDLQRAAANQANVGLTKT